VTATVKAARRIVSRGVLREILAQHAANPSRLTYYELPSSVSAKFWESLSPDDREFYVPDPSALVLDPPVFPTTGTRSGRYTRFVLPPGSYDAWVVEDA
jgi:hypothetical protein